LSANRPVTVFLGGGGRCLLGRGCRTPTSTGEVLRQSVDGRVAASFGLGVHLDGGRCRVANAAKKFPRIAMMWVTMSALSGLSRL